MQGLSKEAIDYFNSEAEEILLLLHPAAKHERKEAGDSSRSHRYTEQIDEKDILKIRLAGSINGFGRERSRYFQTSEGSIGLENGKYERFERYVKQLLKKANISNILSEEFLRSTIFEWFEGRYKGTILKNTKFVSFLESKANSEVREIRVSIPISFLSIEEPFEIGNIKFEYFCREFFDKWKKRTKENSTYNSEKLEEWFKKIRKKYQGLVFSSITVRAEPEKAVEIAKEETNKALMILRFFSPTTFLPQIPSYFGMMGKTNLPSTHVFLFKNDFPNIQTSIDEFRHFQWSIRNEDIQRFMQIGLKDASDLIETDNPSEFDQLLINSLYLFSRGICASSFQDKLVQILVSAETILLVSSSESIQMSVGLKLAHLSANSLEKRKEVIRILKDAYKLRSAYIHHGRSRDDYSVLQKLQLIVWEAFRKLMCMRKNISTQSDLMGFLEDRILS